MSVRFDAQGDYYQASTGMPSSSAYSYCYWAKLKVDRNDFQELVSYQDYNAIATLADGVTIGVWDGFTYNSTPFGTTALTIDVWYKFGIIVNGTNLTFIRGDASSAPTISSATDYTGITPALLRLGAYWNDPLFWWNGLLASYKLWNTNLSQDEMLAELTQFMPVRTSNILHVHPFKVAETTDYSGNGNTLTSNGTPTTDTDDPPIPWSGGGKKRRYTHPGKGPGAGKWLFRRQRSTEVLVTTQTVDVPLLSVPETIYNPTVVGSQLIECQLLSVPETVFTPQIESVVATPLLSASSTLFDPSVTYRIDVPLLTTSSTLFDPTVTPGSVTIVVPLLSVPSTIDNPDVDTITVTVVPLLSVPSTLYDPTVTPGAVTISCQLLSAPSTLYSPAVTQVIQTPLLTVNSTVFNPQVTYVISAPLLSDVADVFNPQVSLFAGDQTVVVPLLSVGSVLFDPSVTYTVVVPLLTTSYTVFNPAVAPGVVTIEVPLLNVPASVYSPSGPSGGVLILASLADVERVFMATALLIDPNSNLSVDDLMFKYYSSLSGLPVQQNTLADHKLKYMEVQTLTTGRSLADLEKKFLDAIGGLLGSTLQDHQYDYFGGV